MQQYATQALNYAGQYLNAAKQWWWQSDQIPENPLQAFRYHLAKSKTNFKSKHSSANIINERLCMMYGQLIITQNSKYSNFKSTIEKPIQQIQIPDDSHASIVGQLKIRGEKIKCSIIITLVFHEEVEFTIPYVLIRNPDTTKSQPNPYFIQKQKIYKQILGGVTFSDEVISQLNQYWSEYKANNLFWLIQKVNKYLHSSFPFIKRYLTFEQITTQSSNYKKAQKMRQKINPQRLLEQNQQLIIIKAQIQSQIQYFRRENEKISLKFTVEQNLPKSSKIELNEEIKLIEKLMVIENNHDLLELILMQSSYQDCIRLIENRMESPTVTCSYEADVDSIKILANKIFEVRWKIHEQQANSNIFDIF